MAELFPPFSVERRTYILNTIKNSGLLEELSKHYKQVFPEYVNWTSDMRVSSFVFYYMTVIYTSKSDQWLSLIPYLQSYTKLYILVDYLIDDPTANDKQLKIQLWKGVLLNNIRTSNNEVQLYWRLVDRFPELRAIFRNLLELELSTEEKSIEKGHLTMLIIDKMSDQKDGYIVGKLMQLLDDCLDIEQDLKDNIKTAATECYKQYGNVNKLWLEIHQTILELPEDRWAFKFLYGILLYYVPQRYSKYYTIELIEKTKIYDWVGGGVNLIEVVDSVLK